MTSTESLGSAEPTLGIASVIGKLTVMNDSSVVNFTKRILTRFVNEAVKNNYSDIIISLYGFNALYISYSENIY